MRLTHALFGALALWASILSAQMPLQPPYERVLVPILVTTPIQGAYGSQWITEFVIRNESDQDVVISDRPFSGCITVCQPQRAHSLLRLGFTVGNPNGGIFLYVGSPGLGKVTFGLRVQDVSRQASTWGTSIPVVREKDVYSGKLQLLNIPVNANFRSALRIYDFDSSTGDPTVVRVRIYDMCGIGRFDNTVAFPCSAPALVDTTILLPSGGENSYTNPDHPGTATISDLVSAFPQLAELAPRPGDESGIPRVRVDIDPMTPGLRFWAFTSVTNNATQHVTVITPN